MNQVGLVGRVTKDPVLRQLSEGRIHASFTIAINRNYKNNEGIVEADFVQCSAWGRLAERIAEYCGKGSLIGVNGRLQSRSYTNKENKKVYSTEVQIDDVRFYILKIPANKVQKEKNVSEGAQVAESSATFDFGENQTIAVGTTPSGSNELLNSFELPKTEEALPIR
ncbi:single-strand DNA-binding protein [Ureibacillus acetophenoni]|uniref:Single-stranded DNA-binding protein n=1 Tax=Ureibacillus acetophenoni TaxID=614649 RepID=A0A285TZ86_9BACL|nr:single-stranded DNA-binding protein [Ureibacillus acetophenoni]SOC34757.1 single-strand DNA-binding protein [Ureibacillus acetophenoni]